MSEAAARGKVATVWRSGVTKMREIAKHLNVLQAAVVLAPKRRCLQRVSAHFFILKNDLGARFALFAFFGIVLSNQDGGEWLQKGDNYIPSVTHDKGKLYESKTY